MNILINGENEEVRYLRLKLIRDGTMVYLAAVDKQGKKLKNGNLLEVCEDSNKFFFAHCNNIDKNLGLELTEEKGQLKIY